ncbi:MAG: GNAT family N-acetyltransferase [Candidatus Flexifilum sp.]
MITAKKSTVQRAAAAPGARCTAVPAAQFSFDELAAIYNQTRIDYIVPMPMNGKRMAEYVGWYDVDLASSVVTLNADGAIAAVGMLGLRGSRAWITRLGVIPHQRQHGVGQFTLEMLLEAARQRGATAAQLEVIEGNEPARQLFLKLGFHERRRLLVTRRAPAPVEAPPADVTRLDAAAIAAHLAGRTDTPSWIDATPSLLNAGSLEGLRITLPDGVSGWIVFRPSMFQITHAALGGDPQHPDLTAALLAHMHAGWPLFDTRIENIPADTPRWPGFARLGYVETFRRIEMLLTL